MIDDASLSTDLTCFIISPIGNRLEPVGSEGRSRYEESIRMWEEVFEPACAQFGMTPIRSDRIAESGDINDQIFTYLRDADVVVADLSHANPNVMYELGLRHALSGKITIQIGQYGYLPFDVNTIRTTQFNRTSAGLIGARNELSDALRAALRGGGTPPRATAIFAGEATSRLDVAADVARSAAPEDDSDDVAEPGIVEVLAEGEAALVHISEVLGGASGLMETLGALSSGATAEIAESDARKKGFAGRLNVTRGLATAMDAPSSEFESVSNEFFADVTTLDAMIQYVLSRYQGGGEEVDDDANAFLSGMSDLIDSAEGAAVGITNFRDGAKSLAKMSSALAPVSKTLVRATTRYLEGISVMTGWGGPLRGLLDGKA